MRSNEVKKTVNIKSVPNEVRLAASLFVIIIIGALIAFLTAIFYAKPEGAKLNMPPLAPSSKEITRGDVSKKEVIFTFDAGDGTQSAEQILAALGKYNIRGTFFMTGKFVEANPGLVKRIAAHNEIFDHTYDHKHLTQLSDIDIVSELTMMDQALEKAAGVSARPYFRAPYGDRDQRVWGDAFKAGFESVYWTCNALDWEEPAGMTADEVKNRVLENLAPGTIYLMHVGDNITGQILDELFSYIESKGYKIVSLTQGL